MGSERPRVLQLGPDVRGGMRAVMRGLFASPLGERYRLETVATHRGTGPGRAAGRLLRCSLAVGLVEPQRPRPDRPHPRHRAGQHAAQVLRRPARQGAASPRRPPHALRSRRRRLRADEVRSCQGGALPPHVPAADVVLAVSAASATALEEAYGASGVVVVPNAAPAAPAVPRRPRRASRRRPSTSAASPIRVKGGEELLAALARPEAEAARGRARRPGRAAAGRARAARRAVRGSSGGAGWTRKRRRSCCARPRSSSSPPPRRGCRWRCWRRWRGDGRSSPRRLAASPTCSADGEDALLVPPGDPPALAAALARLAADAELRERLGAAARERARRLNAEEVTDRLDGIYRELLVAD